MICISRSGRMAVMTLLFVLLLASCWRPSSTVQRSDGRWDIAPQACLSALKSSNASFSNSDVGGRGACAVAAGVNLKSSKSITYRPSVGMSCNMALAMARFDAVVQKVARRHLRQPVTAINHYGSFSCRRIRGRSNRMSQHATARAFDIAGFTLENGETVSVLRDYHARSDKGRFLRAVANEACRHFNIVLTPNHDRLHRDHLHFDIGPFTLCKA